MFYQIDNKELHSGMNLVSGFLNFTEEALRKVEKTHFESLNNQVEAFSDASYKANITGYASNIQSEITTQQHIISTSHNATAVKEATDRLATLQTSLDAYNSATSHDKVMIALDHKGDARLFLNTLQEEGLFATSMDYRHNGQSVILCDKSQLSAISKMMEDHSELGAHFYHSYNTDMGHTHVTVETANTADHRGDLPYKDVGNVRLSYGSYFETSFSNSIKSNLYASDLAPFLTGMRYAGNLRHFGFMMEYGTLRSCSLGEQQRMITETIRTGKTCGEIDRIFSESTYSFDFNDMCKNLGLDEKSKSHSDCSVLHPITDAKPTGISGVADTVLFGTLSEKFMRRDTALRNDTLNDLLEKRNEILAKVKGLKVDKNGNYSTEGLIKALENGTTLQKYGISEHEASLLVVTKDLGKSGFSEIMSGVGSFTVFMFSRSELDDNREIVQDVSQIKSLVTQGKTAKDAGKELVNALRRDKGDKVLKSGKKELKPLTDKQKNRLQKKADKRKKRQDRLSKKRDRRIKLREKFDRTALGRALNLKRHAKQYIYNKTIGKSFKNSLVANILKRTKLGKALGSKKFFIRLGNLSIGKLLQKFSLLWRKIKMKIYLAGGLVIVVIMSVTVIAGAVASVIQGFLQPDRTKTISYKMLAITENAEAEWIRKLGDPNLASQRLPYLTFGSNYEDYRTYLAKTDGFELLDDTLYANPFGFMPKGEEASAFLKEIKKDGEISVTTDVTIKPYGDSAHTSNAKEIIAMADVMYNSDMEEASDNVLTDGKVVGAFKSLGAQFVSGWKNFVSGVKARFRFIGAIFSKGDSSESAEDIARKVLIQSFYDDNGETYKMPSYSALMNYTETLFNASHQTTYALSLVQYPIGAKLANPDYKYVLPSEIAEDSEIKNALSNADTRLFRCDGCIEYDKFVFRLNATCVDRVDSKDKYVLAIADNNNNLHDMTGFVKTEETPCNAITNNVDTIWSIIREHEKCWAKAEITPVQGANKYDGSAPYSRLSASEQEIIKNATKKFFGNGSLSCSGTGADGKKHDYTIYDVTSAVNEYNGYSIYAKGYRTFVEKRTRIVTKWHRVADLTRKVEITPEEYKNRIESEYYEYHSESEKVTDENGNLVKVTHYYRVPRVRTSYRVKEQYDVNVVEEKDFHIFIKWDCKGHTGKYCGGHVLVHATGYVYSFTNDQLDENKDVVGKIGKVDYSSLETALASGLNLKTYEDPMYYGVRRWSTDYLSDASNVNVKTAKDIFDIDKQILYPQTIFPYYNYKEYEGWNASNMELAIAKYKNSWIETYEFDIAENVGCPALSSKDMLAIKNAIGYEGLSEKRKTVVDKVLASVGNGYYDGTATHLYTKYGDKGTNSADYLSWVRSLTGDAEYTSIKEMYRQGLIYNKQSWTNLKSGDFVIVRGDHYDSNKSFLESSVRGAVYIGTTDKTITIYDSVESMQINSTGNGSKKNSLDGNVIPAGTKLYVGAGIVGQKGNIYLYYERQDEDTDKGITSYQKEWNNAPYYFNYDLN